MGINKNTEEMIQMFLKYGIKQSLSVDEFLLLRKQVVDEALCGIKINQKGIIQEQAMEYETQQQQQQQQQQNNQQYSQIQEQQRMVYNDDEQETPIHNIVSVFNQEPIDNKNQEHYNIEIDNCEIKSSLQLSKQEENPDSKKRTKEEIKNITKIKENPLKETLEKKIEHIEENEEDQSNEFSDKDFLAMMRAIED